jgi:hypothetical protein
MLNAFLKTGATALMACSVLFGGAVATNAQGTKTSLELRAAYD